MTHFKNPLPLLAEDVLLHRPPMLFVSRLLSREGIKATAEAVMPDKGMCFENNTTFPEYYIEVIAQTSAMANGYDCLVVGEKQKDGMLVGVDSFEVKNIAQPGSLLHIAIEKKFEFGTFKIIQGKISAESVLIAEAVIKVWENEA